MSMIPLRWEQVNAWRMRQHGLSRRMKKTAMLKVVSRLGAVQAQVMSAAELQVWTRCEDVTAEDVQAALWKSRQLVKSWLLRGTLHLMTADDYPLYVAALSSLKHFRRGSWLKFHDITAEEFETMMTGIRGVLTGEGMTRETLADSVAAYVDSPTLKEKLLSGWGALLKPAAFSGDLCFGENIGQNVTFVRPRDWLGAFEVPDSAEALAEILRRYLKVHAPSTPDEFARWFGFEPSDAKRVFKAIEGELSDVTVEGWEAQILTATLPDMEAAAPADVVRLLPYFDAYTIAVARHVEALMSAEHKALIYRQQGWISPVVVVDGRIVGVWEHDTKKHKVTLSVTLFEPFTPKQEANFNAEAQRLGWFFDREPVIEYVK